MKFFSLGQIKKEILGAQSSPRLTAVSMATGVVLAFSPFPGMHLLIGFILIKSFRLNPIITLLGILVHNPWTMVPIHLAGLVTGDLVLSGGLVSLESFRTIPWQEFGITRIWNAGFWQRNGPLLLSIFKPFFVGSSLLSTVFGLMSYRLTLSLARLAANRKKGRL